MIKTIKKRSLYLVLIIGLILRLIVIDQSLWLDEAIGAIAIKNFSYLGIIKEFLKADNHPPLYYLILKFWTDIFGYSEFSLRFPSVIFGFLTIYLTYLIYKKLLRGYTLTLVASALLATSQFHVYYSQEARMYTMAGFFAALAFYSYIHLLEVRQNKYLMIFSLSLVLMMFSDFVPVFFLPVFWIYLLFIKKNRIWWLKFLSAHLPLLIFGILYLPLLITQIESGRWILSSFPTWQYVAGGATLKQALLVWMKFVFGRITLANKYLYYLLVIISSIPAAILLFYSALDRNKKTYLLWLWFILPLFLGFIASIFFPAFIYFRFTFILPAFYLLISCGLSRIKNTKLVKIFLVYIFLTNVLSLTIYYLNKGTQREDWRGAVGFVEKKVNDDEIIIFEFPKPFAPYQWYSKNKENAIGVTDSIYANPEVTAKITKDNIKGKKGIYYFEYMRELSDPKDIVRATIKAEGFREMSIYNFNGVGFIYYYTI